jgi:hypothetical protein
MKKVLLLAVVALFVMMPFASFAMSTISDSDMSAITAQEGVSIYVNNVTLTGITMTASWGQSNLSGFPTTSGGTQAIASDPFANAGYAGAVISVGNISVNGLLTIDVGTNTSTSAQFADANSGTYIPGGINVGLKNMSIAVGQIQMIVKVANNAALAQISTTAPDVMTMGTAYISGVTTTVNGNILISTH